MCIVLAFKNCNGSTEDCSVHFTPGKTGVKWKTWWQKEQSTRVWLLPWDWSTRWHRFAPSSLPKFVDIHKIYMKHICRNIRINSTERTRAVLGSHPGAAQKVSCVSSGFSTSLCPQSDVQAQSVARGGCLQRPKMRGPYTTPVPTEHVLSMDRTETICLKIASCCHQLQHTRRSADGAWWEIWAVKGLSKAHPDSLSSTYEVTSLTSGFYVTSVSHYESNISIHEAGPLVFFIKISKEKTLV